MSSKTIIAIDEPPIVGQTSGFNFVQPSMSWHQSLQWHLLIVAGYRGRITINGVLSEFPVGSVLFVPKGSICYLEREPGPPLIHFFLNFQENPAAEYRAALRTVAELGDKFGTIDAAITAGFDRMNYSKGGIKSAVWQLIWLISEEVGYDPENLVIGRFEKYVEDHLSEVLRIEEIAEALGISHNHLIRLCRERFGDTPLGYLRQKRMELACQLLLGSPDPIKMIAHRCGIPDLHRFNKTVRDTFGVSPRKMREERLVLPGYRAMRDRDLSDLARLSEPES